ncbi:MAG: LysM peptidoglycan-binding domain-containing protein [Chloroflexi bacterium]|nr:LysM peptidoglycan-binding domain-containing protein [Chloroflexota bacterium]
MKYAIRLLVILFVLLTLGLTGLAATSVAADSPLYHVVAWGDTLFSIANRYNTSVNAIMQTNNLRNAEFIYVGQRLQIPGSARPAPSQSTYTVQNGDTLFSIATRFGVTVNALMQANGLYNYWIYPGQVLRVSGYSPFPVIQTGPLPGLRPVQTGVYYNVRPGDYLSNVAHRFGTTPYSIQIANRLANEHFVYPGQRLYIPGATPGNNFPTQPFEPPIYPNYPSAPPYYPPVATPIPVVVLPAPVIPNPNSNLWEAVLITNTKGTGPCSLLAIVVGKTDWPVVVATTDGSFISDPKLTGTKPERGPYVVEFAHSCTGTWRVIPLGLNTYADVTLNGGHAEVEFHQR